MTDEEKIQFMSTIVNPFIEVMEGRLSIQLNALEALAVAPLDNIPEAVLKMRENEASNIRAVIKEQRELISLLKIMYPTVKA